MLIPGIRRKTDVLRRHILVVSLQRRLGAAGIGPRKIVYLCYVPPMPGGVHPMTRIKYPISPDNQVKFTRINYFERSK